MGTISIAGGDQFYHWVITTERAGDSDGPTHIAVCDTEGNRVTEGVFGSPLISAGQPVTSYVRLGDSGPLILVARCWSAVTKVDALFRAACVALPLVDLTGPLIGRVGVMIGNTREWPRALVYDMQDTGASTTLPIPRLRRRG